MNKWCHMYLQLQVRKCARTHRHTLTYIDRCRWRTKTYTDVHMHTQMYTGYIYMRICSFVYRRTYTYTDVHRLPQTGTDRYIRTHTCTYIHICTPAYTYTYTYTYIYIYIYIYIHTHTHTYMYTYVHIRTQMYTYNVYICNSGQNNNSLRHERQ